MSMRRIGLLVLIPAVLAVGCHYKGPPVQVYGTPADLEALVGEWSGEYVGTRLHGRNGSIFFTLAAGTDNAHGDVLMTPERAEPYKRYPGEQPFAQTGEPFPRDQVLTIRFVRAMDGSITGRLEPYWDPDRRSQATSVFTGRLQGNRIEGTFTTSYASGEESTGGRWSVTRIRRTPRS
jgi:hypothetical protein